MKAITILGLSAATAITALCVAGISTANAAAGPSSAAVEGKFTGKVKFEGKRPEMKPLSITADQAKGCCEPGKQVDSRDPSLLIGDGDGIANVVVTVQVDGAQLEPAKEPLHIDQKECVFEPHVQVVTAGSKVVFLNSDQVSHNVHTYAQKNDSFNKTIAPGSKEEQVLAKGDRIEVKCDIHPWMSSYIFVAETPYHAVTKADGSFMIEGLKPGMYKVEMWHEKLGKSKGEVVIKADGTSDPFEAKMGEKKKAKG